jgi:hypothetical protein
VDDVDKVAVVSNVLVEVGAAVIVVVGVLEGLLLPGEDFFGTLVGMGVEGEGSVGQVPGLFVGFNVGNCVGISVPGPAGIVCIGWVGKGEFTGWIGLEFDEVVGSEPAGTWNCGVTVGTGVSMW